MKTHLQKKVALLSNKLSTEKLMFIIVIAVTCFSCRQSDQELLQTVPSGPLRTMKLNIGGDLFTNFTDILPSGQNSGRMEAAFDETTYLGIKVYRLDSDNNRLFYANGLFDNPDSLQINLFEDDRYIFEIGAIRKGTSHGIYVNSAKEIAAFNSASKINNWFSFSDFEYFNPNYTGTGIYTLSDSSSWAYSGEVDFFYHLSDTLSATGDTTYHIDMMRVSIGLGFRINGLDSGEVAFKYGFPSQDPISVITVDPSDTAAYEIRTIGYWASDISENYEQDLLLEANWILRDENEEVISSVLLGTSSITVKRNVLRMYTLQFEGSSVAGHEGNLNLTFEDMESEELDLHLD